MKKENEKKIKEAEKKRILTSNTRIQILYFQKLISWKENIKLSYWTIVRCRYYLNEAAAISMKMVKWHGSIITVPVKYLAALLLFVFADMSHVNVHQSSEKFYGNCDYSTMPFDHLHYFNKTDTT